MKPDLQQHGELLALLEAVCEDRADTAQVHRLEELVLADAAASRLYVDFMTLHGNLQWDAALGGSGEDLPALVRQRVGMAAISGAARAESGQGSSVRRHSAAAETGRRTSRRTQWIALSSAAGILVAIAAAVFWFNRDKPGGSSDVAEKTQPKSTLTVQHNRKTPERRPNNGIRQPLQAPHNNVVKNDVKPVRAERPEFEPEPIPAGGSDVATVVAFMDRRFALGWEDAEIEPSPKAADAEWVRRAYLDIAGRIPTAAEVKSFIADGDPAKRRTLIDKLLDDPEYVRHFATVWTNLLVGRTTARDVDRAGLHKFLRDGFARNRPWRDVVVDLVSAEGTVDENPAANFLVAHLNNEAVPATAITSRVLLGVQVQCTQCHDHPTNDWKQNQFWELNSFFKQTEKVVHRTTDPRTGKTVRKTELVSKKVGGPTYYETRTLLMRAATPRYEGQSVDPDPAVNRRRELARLLASGENPQLAKAFVNRLWAHFFGYGFTLPIDDMGPHNQPTHPEVLDRLSREFVASGYDVKRLIRWIVHSRPYQLSSRPAQANQDDDPDTGVLPLFSRMYVRPMSVEQLYDSVLTATRADRAAAANWDQIARNRSEWLQQFVFAYDTDENDEATAFEGTIPQSLLMMNGRLVQNALSGKPGTYLAEVAASPGSDTEKLRRIALAALSREPTPKETAAFTKLIRQRTRTTDRRTATASALQDMFWAYLNSNEFILVH